MGFLGQQVQGPIKAFPNIRPFINSSEPIKAYHPLIQPQKEEKQDY